MTLRCRKGDMAMVLREPYSGHFVTCIKYLGTVHMICPAGAEGSVNQCWETTFPSGMRSLPETNGRCAIPDEFLLPIRAGDLDESTETDKTLELAN